jgi:phage terminase small subunit
MGLPKRLTEMQMRFAEFIVFGGPEGPVTQTEAAILAGYSKPRARQEGSELLNPRLSPLVVKYVGELKEERIKKHQINYDTHLAELARIREAALKKSSFSAAVNAETNRGKAGGLYIDRKIIKHGKLEDMTEEQLEQKMRQILDDYAPILNITPESALLEQKPLQTKEKKKEKEPENISANQTSNTHSEEEKSPAPESAPSTPTT